MSSLCFAVAVVELRRPARPRSDHQTVMASADSNTRVVHRRDIVRGLVWVTSSSLINSAPAYSSDLFHPTLSSVAGKVPGGGSWFGPRDVVYPEGFSGTWVERRERVSVETPLGPARVDARILQRLTEEPDGTQTRDIRFVPYREGVVADRWYNACSGSTFGARPKVTQCQWDPDNPNVLSEELEDGRTRETKVTRRRTTSEPAGAGSFEWSEYARVVETFPGGLLDVSQSSLPHIYAIRTVTKYRFPPTVESIEALQIQLFYGSDQNEANVRVKYRMRYSRR